ncbi:MAG: FeoA family protein [Candidatus Fimisoma sp.]|nr:ferrous iron transport protein A [Bacillota bacterium]MDY4747718.1 FeoA family protein [Candidatus Fimisoma sp.]
MLCLNQLKPGEEAVVTSISGENRRLRDLGLIEGTKVKCVLKSPLGDPAAYKIRGAVIAIRREDAADIKVAVYE